MPIDYEYNKRIINMIAESKQAFIINNKVKLICEDVYLLEISNAGEKYKIFGVRKEQQYAIDYNALRTAIFRELLNQDVGQVVEVIGDSAQFDLVGSQFAKQHFATEMEHFTGILLYGYTGQENTNQDLVDVNGMVNNYIDNHPDFARMVLANVVDFDTRVALGQVNQAVPTIPECTGWGGVVSKHVRNFLLVWDSCPTGARFGDDTFISDNLVNSKALLYAGGLQPFEQATNILNNGFQVVGVAGVRGKDNPTTFIKGHGYDRYVPFFETALFFNMIKEMPKIEVNADEIMALKDSYVSTEKPPLTETKALLLNPFRADLSLRLSLWHRGWQSFMQNETWRKIKTELYIGCSTSTSTLVTDLVKPHISQDSIKHLTNDDDFYNNPGKGRQMLSQFATRVSTPMYEEDKDETDLFTQPLKNKKRNFMC